MAGNHKTPLASRAIPKPPPKRRHEKADKTLVYVLALAVLIALTLLITFSILLNVTHPHLNLHVTSIHFNNMTSSSSSLNVTLLADLTISNRNHGPYSYENCRALVFHNGAMIGGGDISGGRVGARKRKSVSVAMSLFESNVANDMEFIEVVVSVKMNGRVRVMKVRERAKTVELNCKLRIDLMKQVVTSCLC